MRLEGEPCEFDEHVVGAVVVQDAGAVDMSARSDQDVRRWSAAMTASTREVALRVDGGILDVGVDSKARQQKEVGEEVVVMRPTAG